MEKKTETLDNLMNFMYNDKAVHLAWQGPVKELENYVQNVSAQEASA